MDDIPLCPTVWPELLIDIIRPPHGPLPDPWKVRVTDAILVAINLYHTAPYVRQQRAATHGSGAIESRNCSIRATGAQGA